VTRAAPRPLCLLVALGLQACSASEAPQAQKAALSAGVVARVDGEPIYAETVAAIAAAQGVTPEVALQKATFDALVAREARARGVERRRQRQVSAELARMLIADVAAEARAQGAPTDEELGPYVEGLWWELNRPEGAVVVQIVVPTPPIAETDAATDEAALAIARKIRAAVAVLQEEVRKTPPHDFSVMAGPFKPDPIFPRFEELGLAVPHAGFEVKAQTMPPFGLDGYLQKPGQVDMLDNTFVKSAFALPARGDLSEPVRSNAGWHVIMMLGRTKGYQASRTEVLARLGDVVIEERARNAIAAIVARGRKEHDASIERSTDELTQQVKVGR
jgi:hypothetical protein